MSWEVAKMILRLAFVLIFGLTQLGCTEAIEAQWERTQVPAAQLNSLMPLGTHTASTRIQCAAISSLNPKSHLMTYKGGVCTLYDLRYKAIQEVNDATDSVTCYTDKKGCEYQGKFYDEDETVDVNCETLVCKGNKLVFPAEHGGQTCSKPFIVVDGVGCVAVETVKSLPKNMCQSKQYCSSIGARLLIAGNTTATVMKEFFTNTTIFTEDHMYWIGIEKEKWLDGTDIADEFFFYGKKQARGDCGFVKAGFADITNVGAFIYNSCRHANMGFVCQKPFHQSKK